MHENYKWDLSPDTRAYVEAYADGLNFYAATHPDKVDESKLPVTAKDVVVGHMLRHLLFYGFDGVVREVNKAERQRDISTPSEAVAVPADRRKSPLGGLPIGSNAFAIAPHFSEEGCDSIGHQLSSTHYRSRRLVRSTHSKQNWA